MKDITGQKFNRLTAVRFVKWRWLPYGKRVPLWEFECECGKRTVAQRSNVLTGHTKSCGCWKLEATARAHTTHGDLKNHEVGHFYGVWRAMKQRCENPNSPHYEDWGGRGIKILWACYEDFKRDMEPSYQPGLQIERKDNNGHYCKENCTWATAQQQALNRRSNVILNFCGLRAQLSVWAGLIGMKPMTLRNRMLLGWSDEQALTKPVQRTYSR